MERKRNGTVLKENPSINNNGQKIKVYSELIGRMMLASKLGVQYEGKRNLYKALGYKTDLKFDDYNARYLRQEIAKAVIDRPVKATWQGPVELVETNEPEDTEFETAWKKLSRTMGLKSLFVRVDKLTGIGRYGVLLLGMNDVKDNAGWAVPLTTGSKLVYLKPFSEQTAKIDKFDEDPKSERYGKPLFYNVEVMDMASQRSSAVKIHFSRVLHIIDDNLESEIYGTPRMEAIFNRLQDIEKIAGGDAEMFWRNARPGFKSKTDPDYVMTPEMEEDLLNQLDEYENDVRRFLALEGVDVDSLTQTMADPSNHMDTQLKLISSQTGIPLRILSGSERGELSSDQDRGEWLTYVQGRREEHAEPRILRPVVDKFIELGILPTPKKDYSVKWQDLFSISEKARVEIGKSRANALREYMTNPAAMEIIPPTVFMMKFLGFSSDEVELVMKIRDDEMEEEVKLMAKVQEDLNPTPPPAPGGGNDKTKPKSATGTPRKEKTNNPDGPKRRIRQAV